MVEQWFEFNYEPAARLLRLRLIGLWDEEMLSAFAAEARALRNRVERAGHRNNNGRILIDLTAFLVQPKSITESLGQLLPTFGERAGRVAIVRSRSALQNMQMQRLIASGKVQTFDTEEEGVAWLSTSC